MMNTEAPTENRNSKLETRKPHSRIPPWLLKALHAEWRKLSPNLAAEVPERELRLNYANQLLHTRRIDRGKTPLKSWNELTVSEARYLLRHMREESGDGPAYRAMLIAKLAAELFRHDWDRLLHERLMQRFQVPTPQQLTPSEAHAEIEELLSRIARRDDVSIEELRKRFRTKLALPSHHTVSGLDSQ